MSKTCTLNRDEVIRRIELNNPGKFDFNPLENWEYVYHDNDRQKIQLICKRHNELFEVPLKFAIRNSFGCPSCRLESYHEKGINSALELLEKYFPWKYDVVEIDYYSNLICLKCRDCGDIFEVTPKEIRASANNTALCSDCIKPWTKEMYEERLEARWDGKYTLVSDFQGIYYPVTLKCNVCGNTTTEKAKLTLVNKPCHCEDKETPNAENFERLSKEIWGENAFEYINTDIKYTSDNVTLKCLKHNTIFEQSAHRHLKHQNGCPECKKEVNAENHRLSQEEFIRRCQVIYGDQFTYEKTHYVDLDTPVIVTCKYHGDVEQNPSYLLKHVGCPICMEDKDFVSKGEKFVMKVLRENNIDYEFHKEFEDCVYRDKLEFDVYIPSFNACIEYQGEQHYKVVRFHNCTQEQAEENFKEIQIKDNIKRKYCKEKGIDLVEIPYWLPYYKAEEWLKQYLENKINLFEEECKKKRPL